MSSSNSFPSFVDVRLTSENLLCSFSFRVELSTDLVRAAFGQRESALRASWDRVLDELIVTSLGAFEQEYHEHRRAAERILQAVKGSLGVLGQLEREQLVPQETIRSWNGLLESIEQELEDTAETLERRLLEQQQELEQEDEDEQEEEQEEVDTGHVPAQLEDVRPFQIVHLCEQLRIGQVKSAQHTMRRVQSGSLGWEQLLTTANEVRTTITAVRDLSRGCSALDQQRIGRVELTKLVKVLDRIEERIEEYRNEVAKQLTS